MIQLFTKAFRRSWPSLDRVSGRAEWRAVLWKTVFCFQSDPLTEQAPPIGLDWRMDERCSISVVQQNQLDTVRNNRNIPPSFLPKSPRRMRYIAHYQKETVLLVTSPENVQRWNIHVPMSCLTVLVESVLRKSPGTPSPTVSFLSPLLPWCLVSSLVLAPSWEWIRQ